MPPCLHVCMYVCIRMCDARAYLGRYVGMLVVGLWACRYIDVPVGMHIGMHACIHGYIHMRVGVIMSTFMYLRWSLASCRELQARHLFHLQELKAFFGALRSHSSSEIACKLGVAGIICACLHVSKYQSRKEWHKKLAPKHGEHNQYVEQECCCSWEVSSLSSSCLKGRN